MVGTYNYSNQVKAHMYFHTQHVSLHSGVHKINVPARANSVINPSQITSSSYLLSLQGKSNQSLQYSDGEWSLNDTGLDLKSRLVIWAEALTLEKVAEVLVSVAPAVKVSVGTVLNNRFGQAGIALAFATSSVDVDSAQEILEKAALTHQVELSLVDNAPSLAAPGLLLMDMDSTVIKVECIDEMATLAGVGDKVAEVTELAMQGKLDFAESLRHRVGCLAGAPESIIETVRDALPLMPGIERLVRALKSLDWRVAIASGGFTYFADYLANRLELDAAVANQLVITDGKLTGEVDGRIVDANVKAETLNSLATSYQIDGAQTIAMGDGANDLVMMSAAALGVAYHAKPVVRQQADTAIRFGGLDGLLWLLQTD